MRSDYSARAVNLLQRPRFDFGADDAGRLKSLSSVVKQLLKRSGEYLFEVITRRHGLRSTMMTSNRPFEEWGKLLGDAPSATAILDRFLTDGVVIQLTGRSYRLDKSEKTSNSIKAQTGSTAENK